jgi:uncharacterized protein YbaR (Trm112 family)
LEESRFSSASTECANSGYKIMDSKLLELLVCPVSKTSLVYMREQQELWCRVSRLAYPINDDIPFLLPDEARTLTDADLELL